MVLLYRLKRDRKTRKEKPRSWLRFVQGLFSRYFTYKGRWRNERTAVIGEDDVLPPQKGEGDVPVVRSPSLSLADATRQMKEKIIDIIKGIIGSDAPGAPTFLLSLSVPDDEKFGHYSTNLAMRLAKEQGKKPLDMAGELAEKIKRAAPEGFFEKIEVAPPGFINFWLSKKTLQESFRAAARDERYGAGDGMQGKTVMVEFTDPNPFKLFHIGHLMSNTIGESFARLFESAGAKVLRVNYQGDVGLHVAKAIWGIKFLPEKHGEEKMPGEADDLAAKMRFLGKAYAFGSQAYEDEPDAINAINEKIYSRTDPAINDLYDMGRRWSLEYFETIYARLGTKFIHYFYESEAGKKGLELVQAHRDVFKESEGAIIFPGEHYGTHTRVFVTAKGLPTYEAKELGLNKEKFERYPLDLSVIVTGNEIIDYFKVLFAAMKLIIPDVAAKTRHVPHGMLRLPSGKMSSRTGDVVTAESLIDEVKAKLGERVSERSELTAEERVIATEKIAIGAIKYSILKQNPGQDIVFDFDTSLSFEGDSGPYLQYAHARLRSILRKADWNNSALPDDVHFSSLDSTAESALIRKILEFSDIVSRAGTLYAPNAVALYVYKLAVAANKFYETTPILKDEDADRRTARLMLVAVAARTLRSGLGLLGIETLEKI
jgi:arginyl-tRNA synthetase